VSRQYRNSERSRARRYAQSSRRARVVDRLIGTSAVAVAIAIGYLSAHRQWDGWLTVVMLVAVVALSFTAAAVANRRFDGLSKD
jgi:4-hydroxybenzoate polyprenyltransferase